MKSRLLLYIFLINSFFFFSLQKINAAVSNDCGVDFSGCPFGKKDSYGDLSPFTSNFCNCILGKGDYADFAETCPKIVKNAHTLDAIAIKAGTRVVFYPLKNFMGNPVMDITGPAIVYNRNLVDSGYYKSEDPLIYSTLDEPYQSEFPPNTRSMSCTAMSLFSSSGTPSGWEKGSVKICSNTIEPKPTDPCPTAIPTKTPTPTKTPNPTPTPTEIPKTWENVCRSVFLKYSLECSYCKTIGDYDCNGIVNGADYVVWRNEFVDKVGTINSDGNCDGKVTTSDYSRWRENYIK